MRLPYTEGSVFVVPLSDGGYARGVVARHAPKGRLVFGFFFGPRLKSLDEPRLDDLLPGNAVLRVRFGDLGLINGEWRIYGTVPGWDRSKWPMPAFVRRDPSGNAAWVVRYSDTNPSQKVGDSRIDVDSAKELPADGSSGSAAVETKLERLLGDGH